jgi:hypothetical protein
MNATPAPRTRSAGQQAHDAGQSIEQLRDCASSTCANPITYLSASIATSPQLGKLDLRWVTTLSPTIVVL